MKSTSNLTLSIDVKQYIQPFMKDTNTQCMGDVKTYVLLFHSFLPKILFKKNAYQPLKGCYVLF